MTESTLTGRRIVVIGGSSGMGLATAHAAATAGAEVTIASSNKERLQTALAGLPDGADGLVTDLRNEADVIALFDHVGELNHLVFTAGDAAPPGTVQDTPLTEARAMFDVRLWGAITAVKYAAPRIRRGGSITLTTGTIGVRPAPGRALAATSAAAAEGLVRGLAIELAPIRVNAVPSGTVRTPMWDAIPEPQRTALFATLAQRTLTGTVGEPENIAAAHLHLMQNSFVTGTILTVDGGLLLA
ncbi:SDR family oxidoreductase [Nocardia sp. BMG111209]|uniref:SDR family oxidoreductase n=1 Tax=Nocardia sp. BMG111209 TaxID=1160137 RepID=UPI00035CC40A|nr:SDR family oxidoreductase [Nocardia sp. BMG111209]